MWEGILHGVETDRARKDKEKTEAKLDAINSENMRLKKVEMLAKYASKHSSSFVGGDYQVTSKSGGKVPLKNSQHYINILEDLDINDELITKAAGYGPKNLKMITERLQKTNTKHQELYGKNSEKPTELYNDALESLIVTQRNSPTFDITKYEELFDVKLTDVEKLNGAAWKTTLDEYVANPVPEIPQSETYLPADPATIAQKVKRLYAADLNRDPNPSELKLLSNTMYKEAEASYQQNQSLAATAQQQPEMTGEEILAGDYGNYAADNVQSAIEDQGLTQIDAESRMREKFDMITDKEKSRLGENYSARNTRATILNSIANRPN